MDKTLKFDFLSFIASCKSLAIAPIKDDEKTDKKISIPFIFSTFAYRRRTCDIEYNNNK
jgi:hypothetical protein